MDRYCHHVGRAPSARSPAIRRMDDVVHLLRRGHEVGDLPDVVRFASLTSMYWTRPSLSLRIRQLLGVLVPHAAEMSLRLLQLLHNGAVVRLRSGVVERAPTSPQLADDGHPGGVTGPGRPPPSWAHRAGTTVDPIGAWTPHRRSASAASSTVPPLTIKQPLRIPISPAVRSPFASSVSLH